MNNAIAEQARYNVELKCWNYIHSLVRSSVLRGIDYYTFYYIQGNMLKSNGLHNTKNNIANYQVLKKEL